MTVTVCYYLRSQTEGPAVSFTMSGDQDSLLSVVSDVRGAVQVACIKIKIKTCCGSFDGSFYCTGSGESRMLCLGGCAVATVLR